MPLHMFARAAIRNAIRSGIVYGPRAEYDPRIAAWLVWSMRGTPAAKQDHKTFNRARRTLQRAGFTHI